MKKKIKKDRTKDVDIIRSGNQITLPEEMSFDDGIKWLQRKKKEENAMVAISMEIDCFPLDGAHALKRAIENIHGFASNPSGYMGMFGWEGTTMIGMAVSHNETVQVPWGEFQIPSIEQGTLTTSYNAAKGLPNFAVSGTVQKKHQKKVQRIFEETKRIVREESVYRGKALKVDFSWSRNKTPNPRTGVPVGYTVGKDEPTFWDVSGLNPAELVFGKQIRNVMNLTLFDLIRNTQAMRQCQVPLKRGVLLFGPFGCGKTLTASVTAHYCSKYGWTFLYLKDVRDIAMALRLAAQYSPCVVFSEDLDRIMAGETRTPEIDEVLNTIDGVDTKGAEIITVLTTNHLEKVSRPMLRPGRLDAVIEIKAPDRDAAAQLVRVYGRALLAADFDYEYIGTELQGQIPAVIREVVERAKVSAIARLYYNRQESNLGLPEDAPVDLTGNILTEDVLTASHLVKHQLELTKPVEVDARPDIVKAADALGGHLAGAMGLLSMSSRAARNGSIDVASREVRGDELADAPLREALTD